MKISFSPPDMTQAEAQAAAEAILSGWITTGPKTKEFERRIAARCGTPMAVCLNSQTACGEMALRLLEVGPGDEVIVPAYTYTATASVVCHVGAKLVMVDCRKDSLQMDYDALEKAITEKTKVIIPVDLGGVPCDYRRIFEIVERKRSLFRPDSPLQKALGRISVNVDAAHAFGAAWEGRPVGSIGDFTSFSFHAVKNLTTAEGGALTWKPIAGVPDEEIYHKLQLLSLHGQSKDALAKTQLGAWEYDIIGPWYKCNMTDVVAAIGLIQFERYPGMLARRRQMIERMDSAFAGLNVSVLKHYGPDWAGSGHLYIVRLLDKTREETNEVIEKMAERGIATNVHYKPLPMMTAYKALGFDIKNFPNAYNAFVNEITLPLNTRMSDEDIEYVIETFIDILKNS